MSTISITIDHKNINAAAGISILQAAEQIGISIPTICYHDHCSANALCRICVVEVEGARLLAAACVTPIAEGMVIHTQSQRVQNCRRTILEMMASTTDLSEAPEIQTLCEEHGAVLDRFPDANPRSSPVMDDNPMFIRDYSKCILCWRCVQVCAEDAQYAFAINFSGRGYETQISTFFDKPLPETTCVFCGQCIGVCPTGALKPKREWLFEQGMPVDQVLKLTTQDRKPKRKHDSA